MSRWQNWVEQYYPVDRLLYLHPRAVRALKFCRLSKTHLWSTSCLILLAEDYYDYRMRADLIESNLEITVLR